MRCEDLKIGMKVRQKDTGWIGTIYGFNGKYYKGEKTFSINWGEVGIGHDWTLSDHRLDFKIFEFMKDFEEIVNEI